MDDIFSKTAVVYIDSIHYEMEDNLSMKLTELKIAKTLHSGGVTVWTKDQVIQYLKQYPDSVWTRYLRFGFWQEGAKVHVVKDKYLRTDSNQIEADNLGELPRY